MAVDAEPQPELAYWISSSFLMINALGTLCRAPSVLMLFVFFALLSLHLCMVELAKFPPVKKAGFRSEALKCVVWLLSTFIGFGIAHHLSRSVNVDLGLTFYGIAMTISAGAFYLYFSDRDEGNLMDADVQHRLGSTVSYSFLTINTISTIYRASSGDDFSALAFMVFLLFAYLLLHHCMTEIGRSPPVVDASSRRETLRCVGWMLLTSIVFGFAYQLSRSAVNEHLSVIFHAFSIASCAGAFYMYLSDREEATGVKNGGVPSAIENI